MTVTSERTTEGNQDTKLAKTYPNNEPESGSGTPVRVAALPNYMNFVPLAIGLLVLFLAIGFIVRSQTNRQVVSSPSSNTVSTGAKGGAARTAQETATQGASGAQQTFIAPPGPKGARVTGN